MLGSGWPLSRVAWGARVKQIFQAVTMEIGIKWVVVGLGNLCF